MLVDFKVPLKVPETLGKTGAARVWPMTVDGEPARLERWNVLKAGRIELSTLGDKSRSSAALKKRVPPGDILHGCTAATQLNIDHDFHDFGILVFYRSPCLFPYIQKKAEIFNNEIITS